MADFVKFHFDNAFYDEPMQFLPYSLVQVGDIDTLSGFRKRSKKRLYFIGSIPVIPMQ